MSIHLSNFRLSEWMNDIREKEGEWKRTRTYTVNNEEEGIEAYEWIKWHATKLSYVNLVNEWLIWKKNIRRCSLIRSCFVFFIGNANGIPVDWTRRSHLTFKFSFTGGNEQNKTRFSDLHSALQIVSPATMKEFHIYSRNLHLDIVQK